MTDECRLGTGAKRSREIIDGAAVPFGLILSASGLIPKVRYIKVKNDRHPVFSGNPEYLDTARVIDQHPEFPFAAYVNSVHMMSISQKFRCGRPCWIGAIAEKEAIGIPVPGTDQALRVPPVPVHVLMRVDYGLRVIHGPTLLIRLMTNNDDESVQLGELIGGMG